jgi:hypothetical protein
MHPAYFTNVLFAIFILHVKLLQVHCYRGYHTTNIILVQHKMIEYVSLYFVMYIPYRKLFHTKRVNPDEVYTCMFLVRRNWVILE